MRKRFKLPEPCVCDALTPPARPPRDGFELTGAHRHLQHELLEQWFQLQVESADSWTERLVAEAWWKRGPGRIRKPPPDVDVEFETWLARYKVMASFRQMRGGEAALFMWAGVHELDAEAYVIHEVNGFTLAATAKRLGITQPEVRQRVAEAVRRIAQMLPFAVSEG